MTNHARAFEALKWARSRSSQYKSANKYFDERTHPEKFKRRYMSSLYRGAIEQEAPKLGASMDEIVAYAQKVIQVANGAANCGELAALACAHLSENSAKRFDFVLLEQPGDHAFVVVGEPRPWSGVYPSSFGKWLSDAWICDPWANLACKAVDYPVQWQDKMRKWQAAGKKLAKPGTEYAGQVHYVDPTDPYWYDGLTKHNKLSLTRWRWPRWSFW